jgi:hypothetical protein
VVQPNVWGYTIEVEVTITSDALVRLINRRVFFLIRIAAAIVALSSKSAITLAIFANVLVRQQQATEMHKHSPINAMYRVF